jgi:hypothetical protein
MIPIAIKLGFILPGTPTIPEQIIFNKQPYYEALAKSDEQLKKGKVNVLQMEELLEEMLAVQLRSVVKAAAGA